jgi:hypothetical protein
MTESFKTLYPAMCVPSRPYKDVGVALNLNRLIVSAPLCIMDGIVAIL